MKWISLGACLALLVVLVRAWVTNWPIHVAEAEAAGTRLELRVHLTIYVLLVVVFVSGAVASAMLP